MSNIVMKILSVLYAVFLQKTSKKIKVFLCVLAIFSAKGLFAEEFVAQVDMNKEDLVEENIQNELSEDKEGLGLPALSLAISKFHIVARYYGLPLSVMMGYFYRKNDFSIFPNVAFTLLMDDGLVLNTSSGILFQKNFFTWKVDAVYDILPFTMKLGVRNQVVYATNVFSFYIRKIKLSAISRIGNKRRYTKKETALSIDFEVSQGIRLDAFLLDVGFFKSTLMCAFFLDWRPSSNFVNYRLFFNLPATFSLYYVDLAFMYSFHSTGLLNSEAKSHEKDYIIDQRQGFMTARESFKKETRYSIVHLFGTEARWYPTRTRDKATNGKELKSLKYNLNAKTNGFFLSVFADLGFGVTSQYKYAFLAEYGLGLGYTLFDCIPFTFQVGLNQRNEPIFFLGVVSRIVHIP